MGKKKLRAAKASVRKIARRNGIAAENARAQMQMAITDGLCGADPSAKALWDDVVREREMPTPEELIAYLSEKIGRKDMI